MPLTRISIVALAVLTLARFLLLASTELDPDEAYVAMCASRADWHYADCGPLPPLLVKAGTAVFGLNEFGVRWAAPLLGLAMTLAGASLAVGLGDGRAAGWTAAAISLLPVTNVASTRLTATSCGVAFLTILAWALWRAIHSHKHRKLLWVVAGLSGAAAVLCHPGNAIIAMLMLALLMTVSRWRKNLVDPMFWAAVGLIACGLIPLFLWGEDLRLLATVRWERQLGIGTTETIQLEGVPEGGFWRFFLESGIAYTPLIAIGLIWILAWDLRNFFQPQTGRRHALAFALPTTILVTLIAFSRTIDPMLLLPAAIPLIARLTHAWPDVPVSHGLKIGMRSIALVTAALMSLALSQTDLIRKFGNSWGFQQSAPTRSGRAYWSAWRGDPSSQQRGWHELAKMVDEVQRSAANDLGGEVPFLIADHQDAAPLIDFYLRAIEKRRSKEQGGTELPDEKFTNNIARVQVPATEMPTSSLIGWRGYGAPFASLGDHTPDSRETPTNFEGRHALYIALGQEPVPRVITDAFARVEQALAAGQIRGGSRLRDIRIYACYDYRGLPL